MSKPRRDRLPSKPRPVEPIARPPIERPVLDDIAHAIDRLSEVGQMLRTRLDEIDPIEHAARWAGVNDEIRGLDQRIGARRDEQQRAALAGLELRPLDLTELQQLRAATEAVAELVRAAGRIAAVAEAAARLADATGAAIRRIGRRDA